MKRLLLVLAFIFLLRVPSFFEPHWYGDEEIYEHQEKIATELFQIWILFEKVLDEERKQRFLQYQEMEKFKQGFAYGRSQGNPSN